MTRHECRWFHMGGRFNPHKRTCKFCGRHQYNYTGTWRPEITLSWFVTDWLPAVSGTTPESMMTVDVAFPFEFRTYESWGLAFRVRFHFHDVTKRVQGGLGTPVDVMNGWRSGWCDNWNEVDFEARKYFKERTGRDYEIGDNTYAEMRSIIQS